MAFCSICGARVQDGAPCPACGASTVPPPAAPPSTPSPASQADTLLQRDGQGPSSGYPPAPPPAWNPPSSPPGEWQAPAAAWASTPSSHPPAYPSSGGYSSSPPPSPQTYPASAPGFAQVPPQGYPASMPGFPQLPPQAHGAGAPGYPSNPQGYPTGAPGYPPGYPQGYGSGYPPAPSGGVLPGGVAAGKNNKIIAAVVIALAALYYVMGAASDPKAVVNKCLDGIQEWNSAKVLECVRPADRGQFNEIANVFDQAKAKGLSLRMDQRSIEIGDKTDNSCTARASYVVTMSSPGQQPQTGPVRDVIRLVQDGGKWYIAGSDMLLEVVRRGQQQRFP